MSPIQLVIIDLTKDPIIVELSTCLEKTEESFESFLKDIVHKCGYEEIAKEALADRPKKPRFRDFSFMRTSGAGKNCKKDGGPGNDIVASIIRYVKLNDRYIALTSLLTKSYLYHLVLGDNSEVGRKQIRGLPRTQAGKPYIPSNESEVSLLPFNISHQFPFIGLAYLDGSMQSSSYMIGVDIVMFDSYKDTQHLYASTDDFLNVFHDSFAAREWDQIQSSSTSGGTDGDSARIKEFFIRWSIKEAYTKALGTGLGTDFQSFDTRLYSKGDTEERQLCTWVLTEKSGTHLRGNVIHSDDKEDEKWDFVFVQLFRECHGDAQPDAPVGCACICVGPKDESNYTSLSQVTQSSSTLKELIDYHIGESTRH